MSDQSELNRAIAEAGSVTVLTGAGCSTASGIPAYRDEHGAWMHSRPVQFADFVGSVNIRRRYWARSFVGWQRVWQAKPNAAHRALAALENQGTVRRIITQNVDDLHRDAGSQRVIDLHGRLRVVVCLDCGERSGRDQLQDRLSDLNEDWHAAQIDAAPDGDARVEEDAVQGFAIADCEHCGGMLKPDVVFFGENVPRVRVDESLAAIATSNALLIVGSSLMVFSGFRFARQAHALGKKLIIVNRGKTRADDIADLKVGIDCGAAMTALHERLAVA